MRRKETIGPAIAILLAVAGLGGCHVLDDDSGAVALDFETVRPPLLLTEPMTIVLSSQVEWSRFYLAHDPTDGPFPDIPRFDFDEVTLAAVAWGGVGGCPQVVEPISGVVIRDGRVEVVVGPLPHLGDCEAFVYPWQIVKFPRTGLEIVFTGAVPG